MSQNLNAYNGASQHSHPPNGQNFEELSSSLIFPDQSTPIRQTYTPAWPGAQGWQNHGQNNFGFGLTFPPPPPIDTGTFLPSYQEDFVPFEKSAEFYENENLITNISAAPRGPALTQVGEKGEGDASREQMKSRLQELMRHPAIKRSSSEASGQLPIQHAAISSSAPKPDAIALTDRAAELRARLLAKRGSTPVASSSVISKTVEAPKAMTNDIAVSLKSTDGNHNTSTLTKKKTEKTAKAPSKPKASEVTPTDHVISSSDRANASTDIDGLFAEARAAVAAESTNMERRIDQVDIIGTKVAEKTIKKPTTFIPVEKASAVASSEGHRRSLHNSTPSSEVSELGEIRSESEKTPRTSNPTELTKSKKKKENGEQGNVIKDKDRSVDESSHRQIPDNDVPKKSTKIYGQEAEDMTNPKDLRPFASSKPNASTTPNLQTHNIDVRQDRNDRPAPTHESRRDNEQDRRQSSTIQGAGIRSRSVSGYQQWVPSDRDKNFHQRDGEGRRTQPPRYDVNESARAAAEYKRGLEARRQQAAVHKAEIAKDRDKERVEPPRDSDRKEPESTQKPVIKRTTSETQQFTPNSRLHDPYIKSGNDIKMTDAENRASNTSKEIFEQDNHYKIEDTRDWPDIRDWLDMTGYLDVPYREKGLARFRKIRALDLERAELEREAQLELEGRSHFARTQSGLSRENVEADVSGSSISPQFMRSFISTMPPPPIPTKGVTDDMGIKIKDAANRENHAKRRANEDELRSTSTHIEGAKLPSQSLKRYHESDDDLRGRPAEKVARIDLKGARAEETNSARSPARGREETWDGETHKTRNYELRANQQRGRNRSPSSRSRSRSPPRGRPIGYDQYIPSQRSRVSPSRRGVHSPVHQGTSKHTISPQQSKEGGRAWYQYGDQSGHATRDSPEPISQHNNIAKEMQSNDALPSSSHANEKYDVKKEEEQNYQPLEDEHQNSRSSAGYYHYNNFNNYRGRGRGRGGYVSANGRGGYRTARVNEGNQGDVGSGALNLEEGG